MQILVFGKIVNAVLGWDLHLSIFIAMVVICTYTMLGGLFAVCFTDIIQVSVCILGVVVMVPFAIEAVGGWDTLIATQTPTSCISFLLPESLTRGWPGSPLFQLWAWAAS